MMVMAILYVYMKSSVLKESQGRRDHPGIKLMSPVEAGVCLALLDSEAWYTTGQNKAGCGSAFLLTDYELRLAWVAPG